MKLGTDFSGIGSPEMALKYLGIKHKSVFACEIDKYARKSFEQLHKPDIFYEDITKRNHKKIEQLDLYVAGFPCQAFSIAGKRKGFEEARGTLFFNVAEFIKINKPKVFVLENVRGLLSHDKGRTFQTIVDILSNGGGTQNGQISLDMFDDGLGYHIYWQVLNTKHYGIPQNRERIFIVGFKNFRHFSFPKKIPLSIKLKDILQDEVDDKYFLKDETVKKLLEYTKKNKDKGNGFGAKFHNPDKDNMSSLKVGGGGADDLIEWVADYRNDEGLRKRKDKIAPCLSARRNSEKDISTMPPIIKSVALRGRDKNGKLKAKLEKRKDNVANCITSSTSDSMLEIANKRIRRLTPLETWRLQGYKDDDFYKVKDVSDTQLYKQAGNSITVDVLMHLFKKIYE
jgi:DNA (cytosine-5)-methyltransferase 1